MNTNDLIRRLPDVRVSLKTVDTLILAARMEEADRAITTVSRALQERWENNDLIAALTARFEDLRDGKTK